MRLLDFLIPILSFLGPALAVSIQRLNLRAEGDGNLYNGEIQWTGIVCGDFVKTGPDPDNVYYIRKWLDTYRARFPSLDDRIGLFFTGGSTENNDFQAINNFNRIVLGGKGKLYYDLAQAQDYTDQGLDQTQYSLLFWRTVYRSSKVLGAFSAGGKAYVYMKPNNCRSIFSEASKMPKDVDPEHGGRATNGEVWYYGELPMLMRNLRINQIVAFYLKPGAAGTAEEDFTQDVQWDANADGAKPRDFIPDTALDESPASLPDAACRPPMKRQLPPAPRSNRLPRVALEPYYMKRDTSGFLGPSGSGMSLSNSYMISATGSGISFSNSHIISATGIPNSTMPGTPPPSQSTFLTTTSGAPESPSSAVPSDSGSVVQSSSVIAGPSSSIVGTPGPSSSVIIGSSSSIAGSLGQSSSVVVGPSSSVVGTPVQSSPVITGSSSSIVGSQAQPTSFVASITNSASAVQASSTAILLHSSVVVLAPSIQSLIDNPDKDYAQEVLNKIKDTESVEEDLAKEVGPPPSGQEKSCSQPKSIFDIFNAVSCISQYLDDAVDDIQKGIDDDFSELDDIKDDLSNIQDIEPAIKYDPDDDDGDHTQDPTQSQKTSGQPSQTSEQISTTQITSSPTSSCTELQTASACRAVCQPVTSAATSQTCSTTCYSTFSGCSATGTISTVTSEASVDACPLSLGGGSSIPPVSDPAGPYTTAWWDYGISCAGPSCSAFVLPSGEATSDATNPIAPTAEPSTSGGVSPPSSTFISSIIPSSTPTAAPPTSGTPAPSSIALSPSSTTPPTSTTSKPVISLLPPPSSTKPPPPTRTTCLDGLYNSFDRCSDYCYQGQCQENAGQPSVTCSCN